MYLHRMILVIKRGNFTLDLHWRCSRLIRCSLHTPYKHQRNFIKGPKRDALIIIPKRYVYENHEEHDCKKPTRGNITWKNKSNSDFPIQLISLLVRGPFTIIRGSIHSLRKSHRRWRASSSSFTSWPSLITLYKLSWLRSNIKCMKTTYFLTCSKYLSEVSTNLSRHSDNLPSNFSWERRARFSLASTRANFLHNSLEFLCAIKGCLKLLLRTPWLVTLLSDILQRFLLLTEHLLCSV